MRSDLPQCNIFPRGEEAPSAVAMRPRLTPAWHLSRIQQAQQQLPAYSPADAIEEWLKLIPDFRLDPMGEVTWSVRGPQQLPMLF
jgi:hypothetical protein